MTWIMDLFRLPRSKGEGSREELTLKEEELDAFANALLQAEDVRDQIRRYISGADIAILANGEEAQPYADIVSLSVYTTTGRGSYRSTIRIQEDTLAETPPKRRLSSKKVIIVDRAYNSNNQSVIEQEFVTDGYRVSGVMYFAPFPQPYVKEIKIPEKVRSQPDAAPV